MKKPVIGICLIVLSIAGMLYWELVGRDQFMYTQVLTVSSDIEAGTVMTRDMLTLKKTTSPVPGSLRLSDASYVEGKEAVSFLPAGAELFGEYFEEVRLTVHRDRGEYIFSIPPSWLISYPQTLRRGDLVTFLLVRDEDALPAGAKDPKTGDEILQTTVLYVKSSSNIEVTSDQERLNDAQAVSVIEVITGKDQAQTMTKLASDGHRFVLLYQ